MPVDTLLSSWPPVRYPACATLITFRVCVPLGAVLLAVTVALVVSDTVVDFRLYALDNLRLPTLEYKL